MGACHRNAVLDGTAKVGRALGIGKSSEADGNKGYKGCGAGTKNGVRSGSETKPHRCPSELEVGT